MPPEQRYPQPEFDFEEFFRGHRQLLERFVGSRIGVTMDTDDIVSEVMYQCFVYCREHPERESGHRALLLKIARNRIADYFARRARVREIPIEDAPQLPALGSIPATIDTDAKLRDVRSALSMIREEYREVITLHAIVGLTASEIADMMEKPPAHIRVLLFRARRALKKALRQQYPERYGETVVEQPRDH